MKTTRVTLLTVLALLSGPVRADRALEDAEITQILQTVTSQPRKAWIPSGTITGTHEHYRAPQTTNAGQISAAIAQAIQEHQNESVNSGLSADILKMKLDAIPFNVRYELSNESTMNSTETVKYDGSRFYWRISVSSRTDSVRPDASLAGNFMTNEFNLAWNREREYAWNGQQYTLYSRSNDSAFVDAAGTFPPAVNGPLTAGIVPWGYGQYAYGNLASLKATAIEQQINGRTEIHLTLDKPDGSRLVFALDAGNQYAVISHTSEGLYRTVSRQYGDYQQVAGVQVPRTIDIEKRDAATNRLLAGDSWYITSISTAAPSSGDFTIGFEEGTQVEYSSLALAQTATYRYSPRLDTDLLLAERLSYAASQEEQTGNCATAALGHAVLRLGRDVSRPQLAALVDRRTGQTSLGAMMDFIYRQGLYCRAVRTDIRTLQRLTDCQVILHIPHKNHFVLLGEIDDKFIWTIDLAGRRFCRRSDVAFFGMDWTQGTALLISDRPINGGLSDIDYRAVRQITGGVGYTCTNPLQFEYNEYCDRIFNMCGGWYIYEPERWGCEEAYGGGMCIEGAELQRASCPCIEDPLDPFSCIVNGDWQFEYMMACD